MELKWVITAILFCIIGIGAAGTIFFLYLKGDKVWSSKSEKINCTEKVAFKLYMFFSNKVLGPKDYVKDAAAKHLIEVYDYLAIRVPDLFKANAYLTENTILEITDYWNSPQGRLFKILVGETSTHGRKEIIIPLGDISKLAYTDEEDTENINKKKPKLRVIK